MNRFIACLAATAFQSGFVEEVESFFTTTEKDVVAIVTNIATAVEAAISDIDSVFAFVVQFAPTLESDLAAAMPLVEAATAVLPVGGTAVAALEDAVRVANVAVAAVTAIATTRNSEQTSGANAVTTDAASAIAAFAAVQSATAALSAVKATAATAIVSPAAIK